VSTLAPAATDPDFTINIITSQEKDMIQVTQLIHT